MPFPLVLNLFVNFFFIIYNNLLFNSRTLYVLITKWCVTNKWTMDRSIWRAYSRCDAAFPCWLSASYATVKLYSEFVLTMRTCRALGYICGFDEHFCTVTQLSRTSRVLHKISRMFSDCTMLQCNVICSWIAVLLARASLSSSFPLLYLPWCLYIFGRFYSDIATLISIPLVFAGN